MRENDINTTPTVFGGNIDSDRTVLSSTVKVEPSHTIAVNEIIDSRFHILSVISDRTSQAMVYLANDVVANNQVAIKLYNEHFQPDYAKLEVFKNSNSPYLAELISYGIHKERFYEAYRYYKNGNVLRKINETPYSEEFVEKIAIPSINEALHLLHEQGIVHADVKPENILISDDGQALVLSDYGISVQLGADGFAFKEIQGTLSYAPRAVQHFSEMKIDESYDYGAMGLVLIAMLNGYGIFENMTNEEIFREWEKGIELPKNITGRLKMLISGLIATEPNERFGYEEVKRWCEGDIVKKSFKTSVKKPKTIRPFIVAISEGKVVSVTNPSELGYEIIKYWDAAKNRIFESTSSQEMLKTFLLQFDDKCYNSVGKFFDIADKDKALFYITYTLNPQKDAYYKGESFGNINTMFSRDIEQQSENFFEFIKSELFEFYLKANGYSDEVCGTVREYKKFAKDNTELLYYLLVYSMSEENKFVINGEKISNLEQIADFALKNGINSLTNGDNENRLYAWLYINGFEEDVNRIRMGGKRNE